MSSGTTSDSQEFTVDSADILRLILGYLTSKGLHQSAEVLRKESGIGLKGLVNPRVVDQCRQGDWGSVLRVMNLCQTSYPNIQEQVILELAESGDSALPLAYSVLKVSRDDLDRVPDDTETKEESAAKNISKARSLEQRLAQVASNPQKYGEDLAARRSVLYGETSKQDRRNQLAEKLQEEREVPLNRLPILIQQAMKWQAHTGQLPWIKELYNDNDADGSSKKKRKKRKHLDLVMGDVAGNTNVVVGESINEEDEDAEPIPQDIYRKVKFGKSAVCESAMFVNKGLITGSSDGLLEVWDKNYQDLNTQDYPYQTDSVMGHTDAAILSLSLSNDNELLASGDANGKVKVWKLSSGKCLRQYKAHDSSVTCLALSRDASRLLTGCSDGACREFGLVTQHVLQEYNGHTSYLQSCQYIIQWSGDGKKQEAVSLIVTSAADGTVRVWQQGQSLRIFQPNSNPESLVVDPTRLLPESPAIHTVLCTIHNELVVVPRSSKAYLTNLNGNVLQIFQADSKDTVFSAAAICPSWVYLTTQDGHCLVFSYKGVLQQTIRNFGPDSTSKTTSGEGSVEVTSLLHHPFQPIIAAFSNDKTQKRGVLTVWK